MQQLQKQCLFTRQLSLYRCHFHFQRTKLLHCKLLVGKYECETWSSTLRKEYRQTVFENRVLRKISRTKRDE